MDYFEKIEKAPARDLTWNIPEQKQGIVNVIGGNSQSFKTEIRVSEFLVNNYPIRELKTVLPDVLKDQLPPLPNFVFLNSTESGSFGDKDSLKNILNLADFNLILGDFSKNTITAQILASACHYSEKPLLITRDAVDIIANENPERALTNENMILFASITQLQKLLRAIYYPRVLLLSQSLMQVCETLHKFTLSYPIPIITLHDGQILIAKNGLVKAIPLDKSGYSPIFFWQGELAAKIVAMNLYNPNNFIASTISAIFA